MLEVDSPVLTGRNEPLPDGPVPSGSGSVLLGALRGRLSHGGAAGIVENRPGADGGSAFRRFLVIKLSSLLFCSIRPVNPLDRQATAHDPYATVPIHSASDIVLNCRFREDSIRSLDDPFRRHAHPATELASSLASPFRRGAFLTPRGLDLATVSTRTRACAAG